MRKLIPVTLSVVIACSVCLGQDSSELAIIRSLLGVPPNTPVTTSSNVSVSNDSPLKIYLDVSGDTVERDKRIREELVQWITQLTKADAATHQSLELVTDASQAQVALIHFTDFPTAMVDPNEDVLSGERDNARASQSGGVSSYSATVRMTMLVHTYIVIKEANALRILFRRKVPFIVRTTIVPGAQLTSSASTKLRKEVDKDADKRIAKANYEKDPKRSDLKLREEFVNWLAAKSTSQKGR